MWEKIATSILESRILGKIHYLLPVKRARLVFGLVFLVMAVVMLAVMVLRDNINIASLIVIGLGFLMAGFYFYTMNGRKLFRWRIYHEEEPSHEDWVELFTDVALRYAPPPPIQHTKNKEGLPGQKEGS